MNQQLIAFGVELGGAVRGGLQHPLVAADDRQKRAGPFLRLLQAASLTDLQRKLRQILSGNPTQSASMNWVVG